MNKIVFLGLFLSIFVFTDIFRIGFGEGSLFHRINFLMCFLTIPFLIQGFVKKKIRIIIFLFALSFSLLLLIQVLLPSLISKSSYILLSISTYILPLFLLSVRLKKEEVFDMLELFLKWFNLLCILLVVIGVIDFLTNATIQLFLADTYFQNTGVAKYIYGEHIWGVYRYYSLIGLPLGLSKYFLLFYSINHIYAKYFNIFKINKYVILLISIIGILLTGSKTGIVLLLFLIIFLSFNNKRKLGFYFIAIGSIWLFTLTPIYKEIVQVRFTEGIESGDLSTGRNEAVKSLFQGNIENPGFFVGKGINYSKEIVNQLNLNNIFNFEYPILMMPFDYGILCTVIFYILLFVIPIYSFIKNRDFFVLLHFLVMSIMVNNNNGLATIGTDYTAQFVFILIILMNMSKYNKNTINSYDKSRTTFQSK